MCESVRDGEERSPFIVRELSQAQKTTHRSTYQKEKKQKSNLELERKIQASKILKCQKLTENVSTCSTNSATLMPVANPAGPFSGPSRSCGYPMLFFSY